MKLLFFSLLFAVHIVANAQADTSIDFASSGHGQLLNIVNAKEKGIYIINIYKTHSVKSENIDITLLNPKLEKQWTVSFNLDDMPTYRFAYFTFENTKDALYAFALVLTSDVEKIVSIDNNGHMKSSLISNLKGLGNSRFTVYEDQVYYVSNSYRNSPNKSYYSMRLDPATFTLTDQTVLNLPVLKTGLWNFIGIANHRYYFGGVLSPDPSRTGFVRKKDSAVIIYTDMSGKLIGGSMLPSYLSDEYRYMADNESGANVNFYINSQGQIINYGFYGAYSGNITLTKLGIFINKFNADGVNINHASMDFKTLSATAPSLQEKERIDVSDDFYINDSTGLSAFVIIPENETRVLHPSVVVMDSTEKLIHAYDVVQKPYNTDYFSAVPNDIINNFYFYECFPYQNGDPDVFKKINDIKLKNPKILNDVFLYADMGSSKAIIQISQNGGIINLFRL